jgi:hypothetical protein
MRRPVPPSAELVAEHERRQRVPQWCPGGKAQLMECPCGITVVLACSGCGLPMAIVTKPDRWCEHTDEALAFVGAEP